MTSVRIEAESMVLSTYLIEQESVLLQTQA